jgi:hypothetical protein
LNLIFSVLALALPTIQTDEGGRASSLLLFLLLLAAATGWVPRWREVVTRLALEAFHALTALVGARHTRAASPSSSAPPAPPSADNQVPPPTTPSA